MFDSAACSEGTEYATHPALLFIPEIPPAAFLTLLSDIAAHGQQQPVWVLDGLVIDGRARLRACAELHVAPLTWDVPAGMVDPVHLAQALNAHRIVLSVSQRAALAVELAPLLTFASRESHRTADSNGASSYDRASLASWSLADQANSTGQTTQQFSGRVRTHLSEMLGVSSGYISRAARVARFSPRLHAELIDGTCTLQEALREIDGSPRPALPQSTVTVRITLTDEQDSDAVVASLAADPRVRDVRIV